jgi:hypothetical protein
MWIFNEKTQDWKYVTNEQFLEMSKKLNNIKVMDGPEEKPKKTSKKSNKK